MKPTKTFEICVEIHALIILQKICAFIILPRGVWGPRAILWQRPPTWRCKAGYASAVMAAV